MFGRKRKQTLRHKFSNFFWPRIGWRRSVSYWKHAIGRTKGTSYSIAAGFACGAAASFTPLVGLHFLLGALLAWITRSNIWVSAIGTAVGNPWTFPVIWIWTYKLGVWLGVGGVRESAERLNFAGVFGKSLQSLLSLHWDYFFQTAWPILGPMLVGGILTGTLAWFVFYFLVKSLVDGYRLAREKRRLAALTRRARPPAEPS